MNPCKIVDHDGDCIEAEVYHGRQGFTDGVEVRIHYGEGGEIDSVFLRPETLRAVIFTLYSAMMNFDGYARSAE